MNSKNTLTRQELLEIRREVVKRRDAVERRCRRPLTRSHKLRHRKKAEKSARHFGAMVRHLDIELKLRDFDVRVVGIGGLPSDAVINDHFVLKN